LIADTMCLRNIYIITTLLLPGDNCCTDTTTTFAIAVCVIVGIVVIVIVVGVVIVVYRCTR